MAAFIIGLGNALEPEEIETLENEFADNAEIWDALGISMLEGPLDISLETALAVTDAALDIRLGGESASLDVVGRVSLAGLER